MANTKQFDGHAKREFSTLATCPDEELESHFIKLVARIGGKDGARMHIERQRGSVAKRVKKRLAARKLL